jgi:hypothetical protein
MKSRIMVARRFLPWVALALLFSFATPAVWAVTPGTCSVATLKGAFGDFGQGTVLVDMGFGPPPFPALVAGVLTYDGAGHYTSTFWGSFAGVSFQSTDSGTYTVEPDCTTLMYSPDSNTHSWGVIIGDGMQQEIHLVYTDASVFVADILKKVRQGECSLESVTGAYALFGEGTFTPAGTPVRNNHVGTITFDGAGHWSGRETVNIIGTPSFQSDITGTYTVNKDCTVTAEIISPTIGVLHEAGVITGTGIKQEIHTIVTDFGWSFADTLKRQ